MQDRRKRIVDEVLKRGKISVEELSRMYDCSLVTIRSDIRALQEEGKVMRSRGYALRNDYAAFQENQTKKPHNRLPETASMDWAEEKNEKYLKAGVYKDAEKKQRIARYAYKMIEENEMIIIDEASTTFYLALEIKRHSEKVINVVTNSLLTAYELSDLAHVNLYMVGGQVGDRLLCTEGQETVNRYHNLHVQKAFIGARGVNFDVGLTSITESQLGNKRAIIGAAEQVIVMVDSSKFGVGYLTRVCPFDDVDRIITDDSIHQKYIDMAKEREISLYVAGE